ncbi:MAG: hypothetical protein K2G45_12680 [Lachnospiraceae bacterium]|nr:hypothetical protein [Lachnospiraceae bacterium]
MNKYDSKFPIDLTIGPLEIELYNNTNRANATRVIKYRVLERLDHRGNTCVCYKAMKKIKGKKDEIVLLKVFYPRNHELSFTFENGLPTINEKCKELISEYQSYISSIYRIQEFMTDTKYKEIRKYLCVEKDFEPLFSDCVNGLSTVYCENLYRGELYWKDTAINRKVGLSQVIQTSVSVMEFLKQLHKVDNGIAYVDIKPEDVLIRRDEMAEINFSDVLFFDLDAVLEFGVYECKKLSITEAYKPAYFTDNNEIEIGNSSENCTYAKGVKFMVTEKVKGEEGEVEFCSDLGELKSTKEFLDEFLKGDSLEDEISQIKEDDVIQKLNGVKTALENNEKVNRQTKDLPRFDSFRKISSFLLIILYVSFGFTSYNAMTHKFSFGGFYYDSIWIVSVICVFIIIDTILIYYFAQKYSHTKVGLYYYDAVDSQGHRIRNFEYNAFRLGNTRQKTTFQDESVLHKLQQGARHIWWIVLILGICVGCVVISVVFKSLPLFFVIGIALILVFMWADYLPACKRDFKAYLDFVRNDCRDTNYKNRFFEKYCSDLEESAYDNIDLQKAIFYGDEYEESLQKAKFGCPFNTDSRYYYNNVHCRDMSRLRKWIIWKGYSECDDFKGFIKGLPSKRKYDERLNYAKEKQKSTDGKNRNVDLRYKPLHMKQIYKMTFDRLKNEQLISNLILVVLTILTVVLVGLYDYEEGVIYSCLPEKKYVIITMMLLVIIGFINVYQTFNAKSYERVVAEMAYKSRYVNVSDMHSFTLNELLARDIVTGYVQEIDIERGTTRYQGAVIGKVVGESDEERGEKIDQYNQLNRPLLHFKQQAYRRHLLIMAWCVFLILFSMFVWMYGQYWLVWPLLILTILVQMIWKKFILPDFGKKKLIRSIERCIKDYEDRQRKGS